MQMQIYVDADIRKCRYMYIEYHCTHPTSCLPDHPWPSSPSPEDHSTPWSAICNIRKSPFYPSQYNYWPLWGSDAWICSIRHWISLRRFPHTDKCRNTKIQIYVDSDICRCRYMCIKKYINEYICRCRYMFK